MKRALALYSLLAALVLNACTTTGQKAPVVDRSGNTKPGSSSSSEASADGTYVVKAGDTLYAIALEHGMDWRELAKMNNIDNPSKLAVGQRLKVDSHGSSATAANTVTKDSSVVEVTPVQPAGSVKSVPAKPVPIPSTPSAQSDAPVASKDSTAAASTAATVPADFIWPHGGAIVQAFKPGVNKGVDFLAKVGDPVVAAGAGKVVYAGNALRGYGNLIIIKHENKLLTAYAHNKTLLVKEGDQVKKAQKIAEAGQSDTDKPKVHFEVRKNGNPVDPLEYLPPR